MEKKYLIKFLQEKQRGVYPIIVAFYADKIVDVTARMACEIIREDLQNESKEKIEIRYFSLVKAIQKWKKINCPSLHLAKIQFKDSSELPEEQLIPGKFKLG